MDLSPLNLKPIPQEEIPATTPPRPYSSLHDNPHLTTLKNYTTQAMTQIQDTSITVANKTITKIQETTTSMISGLEISESEIANHYLDGSKYGIAGTNGTCCSNYFKYYLNQHELISICCADHRNPYNKVNHLLSFWSKTTLSFLLFAVFVYVHFKSIFEFLIVLMIMSPYGYFIDAMATCSVFYRYNYCVKCCSGVGLSILILTAFLNLISIVAGVYILVKTKPDATHFITQFLLSIVFDQIQPLYLGIFNWILHSWEGCLCLPQISCCGSYPCPPRFCPLLSIFPIKFILNMYSLGKGLTSPASLPSFHSASLPSPPPLLLCLPRSLHCCWLLC
jgi:hypothetical protein